jgi:hypothetical protein
MRKLSETEDLKNLIDCINGLNGLVHKYHDGQFTDQQMDARECSHLLEAIERLTT